MNPLETPPACRVLVVDDNPLIHEDFRKILSPPATPSGVLATAELLLGEAPASSRRECFEVVCASSGQEGLARMQQSMTEGRPHMLAFVDVRMPNGWDGVETIGHLWNASPELQVVLCTAHADYSWDEITERLQRRDSLVILKKPFDNVEVLQLAHALTRKWQVTRDVAYQRAHLDHLVQQRTAELLAANEALQVEITARTRAQDALQRSEERFFKAFQATPIPLAVQTRDHQQFLEVNDSFLALVGGSGDDVLGRTPTDLNLWVDPLVWEQLRERLGRGRRVRNVPCQILRRDGVPRSTLVSLEPLLLGTEPCVLVMALDISEQRSLEDQLRQAQKMEAIGQLAAGVAHDFNNVLTVIQGHACLLREDVALVPNARLACEQISQAADRGAGITRQLLAFSRKQVMETKPLQLLRFVEGSRVMLERLAGKRVQLVIEPHGELPVVKGDEGSLTQVLMNLVANARDAMPEGGRITIALHRVALDDAAIESNPEARPGEFVRLAVADTGCGMDTALLRRVFEPFFTTKGAGKGTGLGLSMVYGIVKQHRGWVEVRSAVGRGSEFLVYLPSDQDPHAGAGHTTRLVRRPGSPEGRETLLIVEDDPALRSLTASILRQHGYTVHEAADGSEARRLLRRNEGTVQLMILELSALDGPGGGPLVAAVHLESPRLRILHTSGGSAHESGCGGPLIEGVSLLKKPYDPARLLAAVRRALVTEIEGPPGAPMQAYGLPSHKGTEASPRGHVPAP